MVSVIGTTTAQVDGAAAGAMLTAERITAGYGALRAIRDVSVEIRPGSIAGIVGPNGAGKTTLLRSLSGVVVPMSGRVRFDGLDVTGKRADVRARQGVGFVQEGRHLFGSLTVRDNLFMGMYGRYGRSRRAEGLELVLDLFPALERLLTRRARHLSGGEQQMVAIGRALMGFPRCLLIDEPSLGLAPAIVDGIYGALPTLRDRGVGLGVVEQEVDRILGCADHVYVMRDGELVGAGRSEQFLADREKLGDLYLGTE